MLDGLAGTGRGKVSYRVSVTVVARRYLRSHQRNLPRDAALEPAITGERAIGRRVSRAKQDVMGTS